MADTPTKTPAEEQAEAAAAKAKEAAKAAPAKAKAVVDRGDLKVAVNLVIQTGMDGKPEDVLPGTCFYPATADLDFLTKHEAIREPTDAERIMRERVEELQAKAGAGSADEALG